jgi:hypothetical protein
MAVHRTGTSFRHLHWSCQENALGLDNTGPQETWDSLRGLKQAKGPFVNKGREQKPAAMGGRTAHRALSPKRMPSETRMNK